MRLTVLFLTTPVLLAVAAPLAAPLAAQAGEREVCPSLSGLDTGPCTTAFGHVEIEWNPLELDRDRNADRSDTNLLVSRLLARVGVSDRLELQAQWLPFGHDRLRDRATGAVRRRDRAGDVTLGVRRNVRNPDGENNAVAVQASVTLPVGRRPEGAGDWGASLVVPVEFDLPRGASLTFDPEVDAAVDEDGRGRHLAYGGVVSLAFPIRGPFGGQIDYEGFRDRDPAGHVTTNRIAGTLSWQPSRRVAFFSTGAFALDHQSQDTQLVVGVARLF